MLEREQFLVECVCDYRRAVIEESIELMDTKTCTKCNRDLPLSEYHKDNRKGRGYYSSCHSCKAGYKTANKDNLLVAQKDRNKRKRAELTPKRKVWNKVYYAVKVGKIIKPDTCQICGTTDNIQAHHEDYNKPFDIIWVCQHCHVELDNQRRTA